MSMITTDPVADMLTRMRNAIAVRKHEVAMPHSRLKESIAQILKQNGFIQGVNVTDKDGPKTLVLTVSTPDSNSRIVELKRLSTPGRRLYVNSNDIPTVKHGRGIVIVSTSKGLMTGVEAKAQKVGGELLCTVY